MYRSKRRQSDSLAIYTKASGSLALALGRCLDRDASDFTNGRRYHSQLGVTLGYKHSRKFTKPWQLNTGPHVT